MPDTPLNPDQERELAAIDDALAGRPVDEDLLEWAALAVAVQAEKPEPTDTFSSMLDQRVARGFRKPGATSLLGRLRATVMLPAAAAVACGLVALVVVLNSGEDATNTPLSAQDTAPLTTAEPPAAAEATPQVDDQATRTAKPKSSAGGSAAGGRSAKGAPPAAAAPQSGARIAPSTIAPAPQSRARKVERAAELTLAARHEDLDALANGVVRVTDRYRGVVLSSSLETTTDGGNGAFELRFPVARLEQALADLSKLGDVKARTQRSDDITGAYVDARERLADARAERKSLLRQLAKATTPNQTSAIRRRLRIVSQQIASAKAAVARVNNRADFARVSVTLVTDENADQGDHDGGTGWGPGDAWRDAQDILATAAGVLLIAVALGLPLALLAGLLGLAARGTTRRRREAALDV